MDLDLKGLHSHPFFYSPKFSDLLLICSSINRDSAKDIQFQICSHVTTRVDKKITELRIFLFFINELEPLDSLMERLEESLALCSYIMVFITKDFYTNILENRYFKTIIETLFKEKNTPIPLYQTKSEAKRYRHVLFDMIEPLLFESEDIFLKLQAFFKNKGNLRKKKNRTLIQRTYSSNLSDVMTTTPGSLQSEMNEISCFDTSSKFNSLESSYSSNEGSLHLISSEFEQNSHDRESSLQIDSNYKNIKDSLKKKPLLEKPNVIPLNLNKCKVSSSGNKDFLSILDSTCTEESDSFQNSMYLFSDHESSCYSFPSET